MWKQVAPLFAVAVLIGWFMPAEDPLAPPKADAPPAEKPKGPTAGNKTAPDLSAWNAQSSGAEVILTRSGDGHFYASGNAEGTAVNFLVDTGASVVALTKEDAARLGHYADPGELSVVGRGVSGEVKGKSIMVRQMSVGTISAQNVPAVIIPEGLHVSLLGQSFLSRVAHVTISDNRMTLKN
jgi:aspartyl protease family protein